MIGPQDIHDQQALLRAHRQTLAVYLQQRALLGAALTPPGIVNGIIENRAAIQRIKQTLRDWGAEVDDHPNDTDPTLSLGPSDIHTAQSHPAPSDQRYTDGLQLITELSRAIGQRYFHMQRYLWSIEEANMEQRVMIEREYFKTVAEWNATYWMQRNRIRIILGEQQADLFLDYLDDANPTNPRSLHYQFVRTHQQIVAAKDHTLAIHDAQQAVDELNVACSVFLETITTHFLASRQT
jgi:hypothetical protein